jgi:hypothetical protein
MGVFVIVGVLGGVRVRLGRGVSEGKGVLLGAIVTDGVSVGVVLAVDVSLGLGVYVGKNPISIRETSTRAKPKL